MKFHIARTALLVMLCLLLSSCMVVLPEVADDDDPSCDLVTDSYTLNIEVAGGSMATSDMKGCNDALCALIFFAVPIGSLAVSSSIVVVGNTVHWVEKQGRCDDSQTQRAVTALVRTSKAAGGHVLKSSEDAIAWVKSVRLYRADKASSTAASGNIKTQGAVN